MRRSALLSLVLAIAAAGCGGDADDAALPTTAPPSTSQAAASRAAAPSTAPVAATAVSPTPDTTAPTADGPWTFVDGSGAETTLDETPTRIVAHGTAAAGLIPFGIRPVGIFADTAIEDDLGLQDLDLTGIEIVGEEWGVINVEAVAALDPDLIIGEYWPIEKAYSGMESTAATSGAQMREIAPVMGVAQGPSIATMIHDYEALATALGADLSTPEIDADRRRFEESLAAFQDALAVRPGLTALAVSPSAEGLYVAVPEHSAELADFVSWGLDLIVPDSPDVGFEYWETLSWENADKYQADLVMVDERSWPTNVEEAETIPTWQTLAAVAAGNVAIWPAFWVRNHADYADALDRLTAAIEQTDPELVS